MMRSPTWILLALLSACRPPIAPAPGAVPASAPTTAVVVGDTTRPRPAAPCAIVPPRELFRLGLSALADSLTGDAMFRSAHWGVLVVDPISGDTLYSRNAGKLFLPASNQKLVTGATALARLGAEYTWETRLLAAGAPVRGVLRGDLAVIGSGDPSISDSLGGGSAMAPLLALADSLAARGVRTITGRLIRGGDAFPDSSLGFGWAWDDLDYDYSAPVDELVFNEGYATVTVIGGARVGAPVRVITAPATTVPRLGAVQVVTAAGRSQVAWAGDVRGRRPTVVLRGTIAPRDTVTLTVALRHPAAAFLDAFAEALAARGIRVRGGMEPDALADTTGMTALVVRRSPPLRTVLPRFEKPSQNQLGELLFKTLAREGTGIGTADSGRAVVERQLLAWGADSAGFAVRDGSGLSRHDYLTPETIVKVLDAMRRHPEFALFRDALPIAGVDGTIRTRMRGTPAAGNARAKTGTLDKARNLSGYVTTADGHLLLVSLMANNHVVANREVERVQDALLAWIAGTPLQGR